MKRRSFLAGLAAAPLVGLGAACAQSSRSGSSASASGGEGQGAGAAAEEARLRPPGEEAIEARLAEGGTEGRVVAGLRGRVVPAADGVE